MATAPGGSTQDGKGTGAVKIVQLDGETVLVAKLPAGVTPDRDYEIGLRVVPKARGAAEAGICGINCIPECGCWSKFF